MLKKQMENLMAGQVVLDTRNNVELEIVGVGETKVILINGKEYSKSTLKRYFKLVEQEIPEVVEPLVEEQDNTEEQEDTDTTADTDTTTQDTEEQTNTSDLKDTDTAVNELHEDADTTVKKDIVEGNKATTTPGKTNTVQPTIQQNNLIQSLNSLMDLHGVKMEAKKEYIKVSMENKRGALCMIRNSRYGSLHIDMKSKVFAQLTEEYRDLLIEQYDCKVYDSSRGYYRVFNCNDLEVLRTIILTAKSIA